MTMILILLGTLAIAAVALLYCRRPKRELVTQIDISASPETVWTVLTRFEGYADWNPFIRKILGSLSVGEQLEVYMEPIDFKPQSFRPTIVEVVPQRRLTWLGRILITGLFDGCHQFELERIAHGHTRLHHREDFEGVLLWAIDPENFRPSFEAMNEGLKKQAESSTFPVVE
ncbi:MAG: SRPBCC domain-containing protein [Pseudomonadota bacterium]